MREAKMTPEERADRDRRAEERKVRDEKMNDWGLARERKKEKDKAEMDELKAKIEARVFKIKHEREDKTKMTL